MLPHPRAGVPHRGYLLEAPPVQNHYIHYEGTERRSRQYVEEQHHCVHTARDTEFRAKAPLLATPLPQYRSRSALLPHHRSAPSVSSRMRRDAEYLPREHVSEKRHKRHTPSHVTAVTSSGESSHSSGKRRSRKT
ncbi:hypothetical protein LSAT2_005526 [Lamellibrachia satsuma]|nr:hypothetical protein LSAT2_005526 [Lamellibrachia satsuma]